MARNIRLETDSKARKQLGSETVYLLRLPKNAQRLKASLHEAKRGLGKRLSFEDLQKYSEGAMKQSRQVGIHHG